jgi:hypothetical protein
VRKPVIALCLILSGAAAFAAPASASPASEMAAYLAKAQDAADSNHLTEAIRSYVAVMAMAQESPSAEADAKSEAAAAELARIGTRLSLEPASEWVDAKGTQQAGSSRSLGKEGGLSPAVYLFENFGTGKSPVADAPIYFQFAKNSGSLISFATTDAYGKANTTVAKLDEPGAEALIRAYPVFKSRGMSYAFSSVFRDFAYLPPANVVKVLALEASELGTSDNPRSVDTVATALKRAGLQAQSINAKLDPDKFRLAYAGDTKALASLGIGASAPYATFVLVDVAAARQMELNGKKYNIFTAAATANVRLVRSDGSVVYAFAIDSIKGQGSSKEAAVADAYKRTGEALGPELQRRQAEIQDSLTKE